MSIERKQMVANGRMSPYHLWFAVFRAVRGKTANSNNHEYHVADAPPAWQQPMHIVLAQPADLPAWLDLAAEVEFLFGPMVADPGFHAALDSTTVRMIRALLCKE